MAALQSAHEGNSICLPQTGAGGHPLRQAGDATICPCEEFSQIQGRGFTLHIATNGKDKFAPGMSSHALAKGSKGEVLGHDAVERGDFAAKAVV